MKAVLLAASLMLAVVAATADEAAARPIKNPAMSCTAFSQRQPKYYGMDIDNGCASNVNVMVAAYDKAGHYLVNMWHFTAPGSSAITGMSVYEYQDDLYVHPDAQGNVEYYVACFEGDRKCNRAIDCVRAQGSDDGGVRRVVDLLAVAQRCRLELSGAKPQ